MTKPTTTKPNPKAAWIKELHAGREGSAWRISGEVIDQEIEACRTLLDKTGLPYAMRDVLRLMRVSFNAYGADADLVALAKARLDCKGIPYDASDLIEMIALVSECMDRTAEIAEEEEAEHMEVCADCAGQARH